MTKHTPGPWTRVISRNQAATYTRVGAGDFGAVAECANMRPSAEENAANTRLIAAAPELLAALEAFLRAPSVGSGGPGSSTIVVQDFNLRAARAAIAKATGGES